MFDLKQSQIQQITFVMVDTNNNEVTGLGASFTLSVSKSGSAFSPSAGVKAEIGDGWYSYLTTAGETNTIGPLSITVTGPGCVQQNLEYVVVDRSPSAIGFTYTVTDSVTSNPIPGVLVVITTDSAGNNIIWSGTTDTFGVARDTTGRLPRLDPGTYYFFRYRTGYSFTDPDTEVVS